MPHALVDVALKVSDVRGLEHADALAQLFEHLGYSVAHRTSIADRQLLNLDGEELRHQILRVELLANDPDDEGIKIYLLEVRSLTAKLRLDVARRLRAVSSNMMVIFTKDYSQLDFVLMVREITPTKQIGANLTQVIRPIPLTILRHDPDPVAVRILQRLTFTEADADYQWDKLRSAFNLAEWSEQYFNNRALFSDYYLNQRVTDGKLTPEWNLDVVPIGRRVLEILRTARTKYAGQPFATLHAEVYTPLLQLLGFALKTVDQPDAPQYDLYDPADDSKPIARMFAYVWNRTLDAPDESRDPQNSALIPGSLVVTELERGEVAWVIVTNGKLWRLYSTQASNKATNYYEVDLEEALGAKDQAIALKYWWLMFRREAFTGFLDRLRQQSVEYAKELGDRLKERVFVEIFPQFAQGFIANMRSQGVKTFADAELATVFQATLTFLYRLMFVLYAESLELLPLADQLGYRAGSLYTLKHEIADVAKTIGDQAPAKIRARYNQSSTDLYQRLSRLFAVIDLGDATLNLPTYNGGLFNPNTEHGQFLAQYAVPDQFLALGLDRLCRDVDTRTQALVFIDFKSLGVRQLGSIYEGLLEFKLNIAQEKLAVTKQKNKEIYLPLASVAKPLAVIEKGAAYLANDKKERKATGSYYTPDYIVQYIVQHTVGAVLQQKFAELTPQLRDADRQYRLYKANVEARVRSTGRAESAENFWNTPEMRQLVDACLNIRVLDPAMGSGHFLVEVVDFVSNQLLNFLNAWTYNPIWAFLDRTRTEIGQDMERQGVAIDAERLTRVALLKRSVLKRCIYGVDLNPMAVELAKVSLWLDAFTLGAPLSFLDHHLKHGNSLIGTRVADVQAYLDVGGPQIHMLEGSEFAGLALATDLMRQVSYLSDNTVAQARESATAFRSADAHLAPFKRMLDVYTSRWFGNQAPKKSKTDPVNIFLRAPSSKAWFNDPTSTLDDSLIPANAIAQTAQTAANEKRFFHWELEFPEIFFAPSKPGGQDVQLNPNGGFDAVVGNPPYLLLQPQNVDALSLNFYRDFKVAQYKVDIFHLFIEKGLELIQNNGVIGSITPSTFLTNNYTIDLRNFILENSHILELITIPNGVFKDASVDNVIFILQKNILNNQENIIQYIVAKAGDSNFDSKSEWKVVQSSFLEMPLHIFSFSSSSFNISIDQDKILKLKEIANVNFGMQLRDRETYPDDVIISIDPSQLSSDYIPCYTGRDIDRYQLFFNDTFAFFNEVARRGGSWDRTIHLAKEKIIVRQIGDFPIAAYDDKQRACLNTVYMITTNINIYSLKYILGLLNSSFIRSYWKNHFYDQKDAFPKIKGSYLLELPIRKITFSTAPAERERLTQAIIAAYETGDNSRVMAQIQPLITEHSDVVHDVLAHLAQRMIDLNQDKQAKTKAFLSQLETTLKITPKNGESGINSLTGKTILTGYLGDYQKGERETAWDDYHYRLYQNRNRFGISLSDVEAQIKQRYNASLAELLPIKRELARTDALIDKIVYRLYGLTDAEIELIERPQYEQALIEAKADVINDEQLDDEQKIDKIAEAILPAAERFFERVEPLSVEEQLDHDLPDWRDLPPHIPTFLRTGDYNLRHLDESMDFSTSIIPYTKSVETYVMQRIFEPFRAESGYSADDCNNTFLKDFMSKGKKLTLGSFGIILKGSSEHALRSFIASRFSDAANVIFGANGMADALNNDAMRQIRNKAAHDEVLSHAEAGEIRAWALGILAV